jgi:hypothetical protein
METAAHHASAISMPNTEPGIGASQRFISCCQEELIELELEAFEQGGDQAVADGELAHHDVSRTLEGAVRACNRALAEQYFALDEAKFREVFTLAWCAGYRVHTRTARQTVHGRPPTDQR